MKKKHNEIILAIETAVEGGSLSLLRGEEEICSEAGAAGVARSEDLLVSVGALLTRSSLTPRDIGLVAVSVGPGSYTGIRVGIATALGLKNALNADCVGVQVLEALGCIGHAAGENICAIPIGRDEVCFQIFGGKDEGQIRVMKESEFIQFILDRDTAAVVLQEKLYGSLYEKLEGRTLVNAGRELARHVGVAAERGREAITIEPVYVRDFI